MKRLLYLATLSVAATLLLATAAFAQGVPPSGGSGPNGCPADMPFPASDPDDPGEASLLCFETQAEANEYSQTGVNPSDEEPPVTNGGQQYEGEMQPPAEPQSPDTPEMAEPLPDTGGASLLLPAAGLLLATGLIGFGMFRRS